MIVRDEAEPARPIDRNMAGRVRPRPPPADCLDEPGIVLAKADDLSAALGFGDRPQETRLPVSREK
jgi:hypothetical protein